MLSRLAPFTNSFSKPYKSDCYSGYYKAMLPESFHGDYDKLAAAILRQHQQQPSVVPDAAVLNLSQ